MDKEQKQVAVQEIGAAIESSSAVFAIDYRGISVQQAAELRGRLREADASFNVVKNRLAKRIVGDVGAAELDPHLVGPTALTYVRGDAVLAAKAITDFARQQGILSYKGGIMDGAVLEPEQFNSIARLPGIDTLRGQLVGLAASPLSGLVGSLNGLIQGLASQLGQISEQGLVIGEEGPGEPAPEVAGEEDAEAPAGDAGESDNPGGDDSPPVEDDEDSNEAEQTDQGEAPEATDEDAAEADADQNKED